MWLASAKLRTKNGIFHEHLFYDGKSEALALTKGDVSDGEDILARIHSHCISGHVFNGLGCDCQVQMDFAQRLIATEGKGIIIWLDQDGKGNGHLAKLLSEAYKERGLGQEEAYKMCGYAEDARNYEQAGSILEYFKVKSIRLITNHERKKVLLEQHIAVSAIIATPKINER